MHSTLMMTYAQYVDTSATTTHNPSQNYNHLDYTITCYPRVKTIYCFIVFVWFFLFVSLLVVRGTTGMDMRKEEINLKCIKCILYLSYLPAAPFFFFLQFISLNNKYGSFSRPLHDADCELWHKKAFCESTYMYIYIYKY